MQIAHVIDRERPGERGGMEREGEREGGGRERAGWLS